MKEHNFQRPPCLCVKTDLYYFNFFFFQAVENVARRMSTPDFSINRIEQDLEEELQRESKQPEKLRDM